MAPASDLHPILASHATTESDKVLRSRVKMLGELRCDVVRCINQAVRTAEEMGADSQGPLFFSLLSAASVVEHFVSSETRMLRGYFYQKARTSKPVHLREYYAMMGTEESDLAAHVGSELPALAGLDAMLASGLVTDKQPLRPGRRGKPREPRAPPRQEASQEQSPKVSESNRGRASFRARGRGGRSF